MDPLVTSSLIKVGGSLLGGLLGGKTDQYKENYKAAKGAISGKIEAGRYFGLHPLAAIGAASGGEYSSGNYIGDGLAAAAEAAGDYFDRKADQTRQETIDKKEQELIDAQIAEARSRTTLNNANAARVVAPLDPYRMRTENALLSVQLENGDIVKIPNPDVYETGPGELATGRVLLEGGRVVGVYGNAAQGKGTPSDQIPMQGITVAP